MTRAQEAKRAVMAHQDSAGNHALGRCFPNSCPICTRTVRWATRYGRKVRVKDMEDAHLVNAVRYLLRNEEAIRWSLVAPLGARGFPEAAGDAFDLAIEEAAEMDFEELVPALEAMRAELALRGIPHE